MTLVARSAGLQPGATAFNAACLAASGSASTRTSLLDPASALSVSRQLELLRIARSSCCYRPKGRKRKLDGEEREEAMKLIDEIDLDMAYAGARKIPHELGRRTDGRIDVGRRATASLMEETNVGPLLPEAEPAEAREGGPQAPLPAEEQADTLPQPGLERRHDLRAHREDPHVPGLRDRLVQPLRRWLEARRRHGRGGRVHVRRGGDGRVRRARHREQRPGQRVHARRSTRGCWRAGTCCKAWTGRPGGSTT